MTSSCNNTPDFEASITDEKLLQLIKDARFKGDFEWIFKKAREENKFFMQVWNLAIRKTEVPAWRLLWIMDHATEKSNDFLQPILNDLYKYVLESDDESNIRLGTKLILRCQLVDEYIPPMLEKSIEMMTAPKSQVSNQVQSLEFFLQVCRIYPDMSTELIAYIEEALSHKPSTGYKYRLLKAKKELTSI